jgi:SAM-dependent methyltransferase
VNFAVGEEIWDKIWRKNLITSDYSLKYLDFISEIEKDLKKDSKILEAGCGTGQTLSLLSKRHKTYGLDISEPALKLAQNHCIFPVLGSIFNIPFCDNTFDLVYNSGVIEHFRYPANIEAVKEMARVTKSSGKVIIIVPNTLCLWYKTGKFLAMLTKKFEFGYEEDYSPNRLKDTTKRAGLKVEKIFGLQVLPPLATNEIELLRINWRKKIGHVEDLFPFKPYCAYSVGVIAGKNTKS